MKVPGHYSWSDWYAKSNGPASFQSEIAFNAGERKNFGTKRQKTKINIETAWPSVKIAKCRRDSFVFPYSAVRIRWDLKSSVSSALSVWQRVETIVHKPPLSLYVFIRHCSWFEGIDTTIPKLSGFPVFLFLFKFLFIFGGTESSLLLLGLSV